MPIAVIAEAMGRKDERIIRKHDAHLAPGHVSEAVRRAIAGKGIVERANVTSAALMRERIVLVEDCPFQAKDRIVPHSGGVVLG